MYKKENISNHYFFRRAGQAASRVKKMEEVSPQEIEGSWDAVEKILQEADRQKKRTVRYRLIWSSVAAVLVAGLLMTSTLYYYTASSSLIAALQENSALSDSIREISLITPGDRLNLADESTVDYDSNGLMTVNKQQINLTQKTDAPKGGLNHIIVPKGKRMNITFEDGTRMYVNAGSHVIYPAVFDKKKREIAVEGEVFLDVTRDPKRPFIVKTNKFDIKVLGTSFNVSAYKEDKSASVVLVKGCVEVKTDHHEKVVMSPDERVCITNGETQVEKVKVFQYICWKDNLMYLKNDKLGGVLDRIARYYGATIDYDAEVADILISGKLDLQGSIESVLEIVDEMAAVVSQGDSESRYRISLKQTN